MKTLNYSFEHVTHCEMCDSDTRDHIVLGQRLNKSQGTSPRTKSGISVSVMKCRNCDLIYPQPLPIPSSIQDHYGIPAEDYWTPEMFIIPPDYFSRDLDIAKKLLLFKEGMTALDIGVGVGKAMISMGNAGFDVYGLEPSIPFHERAISKMSINPEKLKLGSVEDIEYDAESFDFITYGAVFEHLYHPAQTLEKALKWLKPNGIIHIEVPSSKYTISKLINLYFRLIGTNYVTHISPMHPPFHLYEFGLKSFQELGDKINFKIERYDYLAAKIEFVPHIFHSFLYKYMNLRNTQMQLSLYLRKM